MVIFGDIVLALAAIYLFAGFAAALRFITVTAPSFSPRAQVGSLLFRAILIPGAVLLWPVTLRAGAHGVGRPASREPGHAEPQRADAGRGEGDA